MSKTFTSKPTYAATQRGRGRGTNARGRAQTTNQDNKQTTNISRGRGSGPNTQGRGLTSNRNNNRSPQRVSQRGRNMSGDWTSPGYNGGTEAGYRGGTGAGRGHQAGIGRGTPQTATDYNAQDGASGETLQDRTERRDAYTVVKPNEQKREAVQNQARKGEEAYAKHKAASTPQRVSYVGSVGGGQITEGSARNQQQREHRNSQTNVRNKREEYRAEEKRREDEENQRKKDEARRKSAANDQRDRERQNRKTKEHDRDRQQWLDRLDQKTQEAKTKKILSSSAARSIQDTEPDDVNYRLSEQSAEYASQGATGYSSDANHRRPEQRAHYSSQGATGHDSGSAHQRSLQRLVRRFPTYDEEVLRDMLESCGGDVDYVIQLLDDQRH